MEYKCEFCNKNYSSRQSRWNHIKNYHNKSVVEDVVKSFKRDGTEDKR